MPSYPIQPRQPPRARGWTARRIPIILFCSSAEAQSARIEVPVHMPTRPKTHRAVHISAAHGYEGKRSFTDEVRVRGRAHVERRARILRSKPLCAVCLDAGRYERAAELDHKVPLWEGGAEHEANLQPLCTSCHAAKTAAEGSRLAAHRRLAAGSPARLAEVALERRERATPAPGWA